MPANYAKGQSIRTLTAADLNLFKAAGKALDNAPRISTQQLNSLPRGGVVLVQNNSGAAVPQFGAVGLDSVAIDNTGDDFHRGIFEVQAGSTPWEPNAHAFGVAQRPAANGEIIPVIVLGVTPAKIVRLANDASDICGVDPTGDSGTYLVTGFTGARILWEDTGATPTDPHDAFVCLGGSADVIERFKITDVSHTDYITCVRWLHSIQGWGSVSEYVAKPEFARGATLNNPYAVDDVIWAVPVANGTGVAVSSRELRLLDLNVDARTEGGGGSGIVRAKVVSVGADYIVVKRWTGSAYSGTSENVAKPYLLRNALTTWNGLNYTYTSNFSRTVSGGESQVIVPAYVLDDVIYIADSVDTGVSVSGTPLTAIDMNVDGRAYARL